MSAVTAVSSGEEIWQPKGNPWIIAVAVSLAAFMEVLDTSIANVALPHIAGKRVWQYIPVAFLFVPLTLAGYVGLPAGKTNAAAGLMNFMRNIGQSVGTSAVATLIARRSQYHQSVLAGYTASARFHDATTALAMRLTTAGLSAHAAQQQALARMYALVQSQAAVLSYVEVYWLLAMACVAVPARW
jgi:DHA2 family multidrug resistance protein